MKRTLCLAGGVLGVMSLSTTALHAQNVSPLAAQYAARVTAALPAGRAPGNSTAAPAPRPVTVKLRHDNVVLGDTDQSGGLSVGDTITASGAMLDTRNNQIGSWGQATRVASEEDVIGISTFSLRFTNKGTVTLTGSPNTEASPVRVNGEPAPGLPIVGTIGKGVKNIQGGGYVAGFSGELGNPEDPFILTMIVGVR